MTQSHYAIMRFAKYKGPEITNIEVHNERRKENYASNPDIDLSRSKCNFHLVEAPGRHRAAKNGKHEETDERLKGVLPMADNKQRGTRTARRPDCVTEIRMANSVPCRVRLFQERHYHHRRRQNGVGTESESRCYTGAYLSGVS